MLKQSRNNKSENIIEVKNARKIYRMGKEKIVAVDDVSFNVKRGEFLCLYGSVRFGKVHPVEPDGGIEKLTAGQIMIRGTTFKE